MRKSLVLFVALAMSFGMMAAAAAQISDTPTGGRPSDIPKGGPPSDIVTGPPPEALEDYEPTNINEAIALPGIPAEGRAAVGDAAIVEIYCLMTQWRAGELISALEAIDEHLTPAMDAVRDVGATVTVPNAKAYGDEARAAIQAVCDAKTIEDATDAARGVQTVGQKVRDAYANLKRDMMTQLSAKGEELKRKIQDAVEPEIQSEVDKVEASMQAEANRQAGEAKAQIEAELTGKTFKSAEEAEAHVRTRIPPLEAKIRASMQALSESQESRLKAFAEEVVALLAPPEKAKFEALGGQLNGLNAKIKSGIAARLSAYETYHEQALAKRQAIIMKMVDASLAQAMEELKKNQAAFAEMKAADSNAPTIVGIEAEMAADRAVLEGKLQAAIVAENELGIDSALAWFRGKWEGYRQATEEAFRSPARLCAMSTSQFAPARAQMDRAVSEMAAVNKRCAGQTDEICLKAMELQGRFSDIVGQMSDMKATMSDVETICATASTNADADRILATLEELKVQGEAAQTLGAALEAEKKNFEDMAAQKVQDACADALVRIEAGRVEMERNYAPWREKLTACKTKPATDAECQAFRDRQTHIADIQSLMTDIEARAVRVETACENFDPATPPEQMWEQFRVYQGMDAQFSSLVAAINSDVANLMSSTNVCATAQPLLEAATREYTVALGRMSAAQRSAGYVRARTACRATPTRVYCDEVRAADGRIAEINRDYAAYGTSYWAFHRQCVLASGSEATRATISRDGLITQVTAIQTAGKAAKDRALATEAALTDLSRRF